MNGRADVLGRYVLFILRLYLGWSWLAAGWEKILSPGYHGQGPAVVGFLQGALKAAPFGWYKSLIASVFLPHSGTFAFLVSWGELLVGLGLLFGLLTNLAALFAIVMNLSFLLAGTVSTNATYIMMELALIFGTAGLVLGIDVLLVDKGSRMPLIVPDPQRITPPAFAWVTAAVLFVLAALAYGTAGTLKLPEFSNPAGQLSRVLFFAAVLYGVKALHDGQRQEKVAIVTEQRQVA
jgi:thiosulfate dehydrogenase [quinone] large subunit